jgi:hypothetical protein
MAMEDCGPAGGSQCALLYHRSLGRNETRECERRPLQAAATLVNVS